MHQVRLNKQHLVAACLLMVALSLNAQQSTPTIVDVSQCLDIVDVNARLACYDALSQYNKNGAPVSSTNQTAIGAESNEPKINLQVIKTPESEYVGVPKHSNRRPVNEFGTLQRQDNRQTVNEFGKSQARVVESDDRVELHDRIVSIEKDALKLRRITLASGQIWKQVISKAYFLKEGQDIRIFPGSMGRYYFLSANNVAGSIQVERIK